MSGEHIPDEIVRAYLLGTLDEVDAVQLEQLYFLDPACLHQVQSAERHLIESYLRGSLTGPEAEQFKKRYLRIPALRRILDEVQYDRTQQHEASRHFGWRLTWVVAICLCVGLLCVWVFWKTQPGGNLRTSKQVPEVPEIVQTVHLSPGATMSGGQASQLSLSPGLPVKLIAELPGLREPIECTARLSVVGADGKWMNIWSAPPSRTVASDGGQELTLVLNPSKLQRGDYVLEVRKVDSRVLETYLFHVTALR